MSLALLPPTVEELSSYQMMAKIAIHNPMWRKIAGSGTPDEQFNRVLSAMLLAREIGIQPMSAASWGLNNVNDKFEVSARANSMSRGFFFQPPPSLIKPARAASSIV